MLLLFVLIVWLFILSSILKIMNCARIHTNNLPQVMATEKDEKKAEDKDKHRKKAETGTTRTGKPPRRKKKEREKKKDSKEVSTRDRGSTKNLPPAKVVPSSSSYEEEEEESLEQDTPGSSMASGRKDVWPCNAMQPRRPTTGLRPKRWQENCGSSGRTSGHEPRSSKAQGSKPDLLPRWAKLGQKSAKASKRAGRESAAAAPAKRKGLRAGQRKAFKAGKGRGPKRERKRREASSSPSPDPRPPRKHRRRSTSSSPEPDRRHRGRRTIIVNVR